MACACLGIAGLAAAQATPFEVARRDGRVLAATEVRGDPDHGWLVTVQGKAQPVPASELLLVLAAPVHEAELASVHLAGGDVLRGALVGGDAAGDRLELLSPVLGRVVVRVDRVAALAAPGCVRPLLLRLPDGVQEGLFVRAAIGYDLVAGTLHQFGEQGVRFQPDGAAAPRWYSPRDFVALRIADAARRGAAAPVQLLTRAGDRIGVTVTRIDASTMTCELEGGAVVQLRLADLACASFAGSGTFLSDLEPSEVVESGFGGEAVYAWQRDRAATGGALAVAGRAHGRGLGVHSRSRLSFTAPEGSASFWTRIGIDDTAAALRPQANADVRVLKNGKLVFEENGLEPGRAPRDTGLIPVQAGDTLTLEVDFGRGRELGDRVDWLSPIFLTSAGRRP
ncbi:MAG TPA: NPCBM/NEW2 domain-containing protein [Planctomycetota bacterium]|nr:NPCBM/NEW2 domain-containing protein [Planctomycetota bacterium]